MKGSKLRKKLAYPARSNGRVEITARKKSIAAFIKAKSGEFTIKISVSK